MRLIIRLVLTALAFTTVLPIIPGISFHGNFLAALGISIVFGLMLWAVELVISGIAAVWTIGSLGLALLWLIPAWLFGFWLLPAVALMLTASMFPDHLVINGFLPAALAGIALLLVGLLTSKIFWREKSKE